MKLGLGLYRHMLTPDNFRFARQAGRPTSSPTGSTTSRRAAHPAVGEPGTRLGVTRNQGRLWSVEELTGLREAVEAEGLELAAVENLDPSHWHDVLLDGPDKRSTSRT
jgi:mannonate dehydratase